MMGARPSPLPWENSADAAQFFFLGPRPCVALGPAALFCVNLRRFQAPAPVAPERRFPVSVLIPARDEEANIGDALRCVLASRGVALEVLVLDDDSRDGTADVVRLLAAQDSRVRLLAGRELPNGWNGKQHACWTLANEASSELLIFLDADVRVEAELFARMAGFLEQTETALVSGFPRLVTVTWLEQLLLPLIHFVLLGFLPMGSMRRSTKPAFAAGCGQFMVVKRAAYVASGGHSAIRETMHDGLLLPRVLRTAGYRTDLADITELASVRMYDSAAKVWNGLAKNATEGIATAAKIVPLTIILVLGQVVPGLVALALGMVAGTLAFLRLCGDGVFYFLLRHGWGTLTSLYLLAHGALLTSPPLSVVIATALMVFVFAVVVTYLPRLLAVRRFRQSLRSALLHPVGIIVLLAVQWYALGRKLFGRPVGWRQRSYSSETGTQVG